MGIFIKIQTDNHKISPEIAEQLVSLCPVDIFARLDRQLVVRSEQEDECTLCELCLDTAPAGALTIHKLYKEEAPVSRAKNNLEQA